MLKFKSFFYLCSNAPRNCIASYSVSPLVRCQKWTFVRSLQKTNLSDARNNLSYEVPGTMKSRYEKFTDPSMPDVLDVEEERRKVEADNENLYDGFLDANLERGVSGVFDIEELVDILRKEKAQDIFVVKVPLEFSYVDFIVVATGRSTRHMLAMSQFIRKLYKKKRCKSDKIPILEGKNSKNWMALDLGNIALHVFSKTEREIFDLETLWTAGKQYDTHFKKIDSSDTIRNSYSQLLAKLAPDSLPNS